MMARPERRLKFRYSPISGQQGFMDQVLIIKASGRVALAPTLRLAPIDAFGRVIEGVTVHTAYGSDQGRLAVQPRVDNVDVLYFRGTFASQTADVAVEVLAAEEVTGPITGQPGVIQFDGHGRQLGTGGGFACIHLVNPDPQPMLLRVAVIVMQNVARPPQGAIEVLPLTPEPILVPPRSRVQVNPLDDVRRLVSQYAGLNFIGVKAYPAAW